MDAILGEIPVIGLYMLMLPAFALQPDGAPFIGHEPDRIHRFHKEQQARLRAGAPWTEFVEGPGVGWLGRFDERTGLPLAAWGPSVPVDDLETVEDAESAVREFFARSPSVLGVSLSDLRLGRSGHDTTTDTWYVQLDQVLPGSDIPVWRGTVDAVIKKNQIIFFSVNTVPDLSYVDADPGVTKADAIRTATAQGPAGNAVHSAERASLTVLPLEVASALDARLAWQVKSSTSTPRGEWVSFVDAQTGEILSVHNEVRFLTGEVHAEHDVRTPNGEMMESPMRWMRIQGDGEATYTDEDGVWSLEGEEAPSGDLVGEYVRIRNQGGANADIEGLTDDTLLTEEDADQAELSAFVFQSQIRQWAMLYAPEIPLTDTRIDVYVNVDETCNAYFDGSINLMRAGSGCRNTGRIADVNYHEWGHGFHYYSLLSGEFDGAMSEGIADAVSMLNTGDPIIAPGFFNSGYAIRELETNRVYPDDIVNEVHTDGLIFGGAVWDLVNVLADEMGEEEAYDKVSRLLAAAIKSGPTLPEAFDAFIVADDDNGDLSDGTPNSCSIIEAFSQHGLGPGGGGGALVVLDHTPPTAAEPASDIDLSLSALNLAPECVDVALEDAAVHYSTDGGSSWETLALSGDMDSLTGSLPAQTEGTVVSYYFTLSAEGLASSRAPRGGEINPYTVYVGGLTEIYCEDFEGSDGGFTHELVAGQNEEGADDWMWGTPIGLGGDPDFAFLGNKVWGNDLGGGQYNGEYQNEKHNRLSSVEIDVGDAEQLVLQYRRWLNVEDGYYDQANILANGVEVWTNHGTVEAVGDEHHRDDQWMLHAVPIEADGSGMLTLSWEVITDRGLTMGGWNIDDVCVYARDMPSPEDPGESGEDEGGVEAYEAPAVSGGKIAGPPSGCACSTGSQGGHFGWLAVLLGGLITAARRKEG